MTKDPKKNITDLAKQEINAGSDLAKMAIEAIKKAGNAKDAIAAVTAEMNPDLETRPMAEIVKETTGLDIRDESRIMIRMYRRLGITDANAVRKAVDSGADYLAMVDGMAKLLHPGDETKHAAAAERMRAVFQRMSEWRNPSSFDTAYQEFVQRAKKKQDGWKQERGKAYHRMATFAGEMHALQAYCEQAMEEGFLTSQNRLTRSVVAWVRDADAMAEALRKLDARTTLGVSPLPATTAMGAVIAEATPFAAREKPEKEDAIKKIIAEKTVLEIPDLNGLKAALQNGNPDKPEILEKPETIDKFMRELGDDQILNKNEATEHVKSLKKEVAKLRSAIGRVESGDAANLGALTSALEVLHTHIGTLYERVRERQSKIHGFPIEEALPEDSGSAQIDATIALEKLRTVLGKKKKSLASGHAITD